FFVPPLLNALVSFLSRNVHTRMAPISGTTRHLFLCFHLFTSFMFAVFVSLTGELQVLSGLNGDLSPAYESYSYEFITWVLGAGTVFVGTAGILARFLGKSSLPDFMLWFKLSDTSTDYFPRQRSNLIFANSASMAPPIEWIGKKEEEYRYEYQRLVPTSDDAKGNLLDAAERSRDLIREYLFEEKVDRTNFSIEFLPLTSRGLEVGLTHIPKLDKIVVSPYEHPSQKKVVDWFKEIHPSVKSQSIPMDYKILRKSWNDQRDWLLNNLRSAIRTDTNGGPVAILISEVHYLTGLVINVTEVIESLRTNGEQSNLVFIVDGSQSVGNLLRPFNNLAKHLRDQDFYYFSAHKWLLSPNTCGVLITRIHADRYKVRPYDLFGPELPSSTIDPGVIFGIKASLEFLIERDKFHLNRFRENSNALKAYFIKEIREQFEVVQSASHEMNLSNFVAVHPRSGYRWKEKSVKEFWDKIRDDDVDLTVDELDGSDSSKWWLRVSFPYFLQLHLLNRLIKHLKSRVTSSN
ncbi:MAG TPA: aminotransferase class V-fold PLP-dependent enzyme, partial [Pyrinomonadaceae bacterium]|nr:aminotransferase class V-fold PLP-dependent enzyme [Pyrinomonadaceae bacterium]